MANSNPKNKFSSDNQPKGRGESYRTKLLAALKQYRNDMDEETFLKEYISKAFAEDGAAMLREIFIRISPVPKSVAPNVEFHFPDKGSPVEKIDSIIKAVSIGSIPADIAQMIVSIIKIGIDVQETTELMERVAKLEALLSGGLNGESNS